MQSVAAGNQSMRELEVVRKQTAGRRSVSGGAGHRSMQYAPRWASTQQQPAAAAQRRHRLLEVYFKI
eukprot:SAG31_NODE_30329_length_382_cov_1.452297_1_plen_67_part_00